MQECMIPAIGICIILAIITEILVFQWEKALPNHRGAFIRWVHLLRKIQYYKVRKIGPWSYFLRRIFYFILLGPILLLLTIK